MRREGARGETLGADWTRLCWVDRATHRHKIWLILLLLLLPLLVLASEGVSSRFLQLGRRVSVSARDARPESCGRAFRAAPGVRQYSALAAGDAPALTWPCWLVRACVPDRSLAPSSAVRGCRLCKCARVVCALPHCAQENNLTRRMGHKA